MRAGKRPAKVVEVVRVSDATDIVIISKPVFVAKRQVASQFEIPVQESIEVEEVDIFISAGHIRPGHRVSIAVNSRKRIIRHLAPVMPHTEVKIQRWCKIVIPGER